MMLFRKRFFAPLTIIAVALALTFGAATNALAGPAETLGLTELRQMLKDSPTRTVDGYFKTVLQGQTIEQVNVKIKGTTAGAPDKALILFETTDADVLASGGIAFGMSGSPIYVTVGTTDTIVGAVSYGDWFTLAGTGLATPIESMLALRTTYGPTVYEMPTPIISGGKVIERVIVSPDPQDLAGEDAAGALIAKPLSTVFIGGLRPGSKPYKMLAKTIAARGLTLAPEGLPLTAGPLDDDAMVATDLVPGAAIAAMDARGDMWAGALGTVTYDNGSDVLAFGHPYNWDGKTSLYMMNAWIDGVWPSAIDPYKMGSPTLVRGTITQDRYAGVLGQLDEFPADTTITAHAYNTDTGESTSSAVYMPRAFVNRESEWGDEGYYVASGLSVALQKLVDSWSIKGSAQTTTTLTVSDGTTVYTVVVPNFYDSTYLDWDVTWDAWGMIDELHRVLRTGTEKLDIMSVDLDITYTEARRNARIAGVDVIGGLKTGDNTATVTFVPYGVRDFVTQEVTFSLPATVPLNGSLSVNTYGGYYSSGYGGSNVTTPGAIEDWITTVAEVISDISTIKPNNVLSLVFSPRNMNAPCGRSITIETSATTPWYLRGSAHITSPMISAYSSTANYRGTAMPQGYVRGPRRDSLISIYGTPASSDTESLLATTTATYDKRYGLAWFSKKLGNYPTNMNLRIRVEPSDGWLSGDTTCTLKVRPSTSFRVSKRTLKRGQRTRLYATLRPRAAAGAKVAFQVFKRGRWVTRSTKTLVASGSTAKASYSWKPAKGKWKVRARFLGSTSNAATNSRTIRINVK